MKTKMELLKEIAKDTISFILIFLFSDYIFINEKNKILFILIVAIFYIIHFIFFMREKKCISEKCSRLKSFMMPTVFMTALAVIIFKAYIMNDGTSLVVMLEQNLFMGKIIYFSLCFVTPYIIFMSEPFTIMTGNTVFSTFWAFALGYLGTIGGIISLFMLVRKKGNKYIKKLIKEKELEKYREFVGRNEGIYLAFLFVFPILPDGVICGGAGLSDIKWKKFVAIAFASKLFTVGVYTFFVDWLKKNSFPINMWSLAVGLGVVYLIYERYKKRKNLR